MSEQIAAQGLQATGSLISGEYGLIGIMLGLSFLLIGSLLFLHRKERSEWDIRHQAERKDLLDSLRHQHSDMEDLAKETNKTLVVQNSILATISEQLRSR